MRVSDRISGIFFAALGLAILIAAWGYRTPGGGLASPALFPMIVGGIIVLSGLGVAIGVGGDSAEGSLPPARINGRALASILVVPLCIVFYTLFAGRIGSIAASFVIVLAPALVWRVRFPVAVIVALVAALAVNALFILALRVPLPRGLIEGMLF